MIAVRHTTIAATFAVFALAACQTTPKPEETATMPVVAGDFVPVAPASQVHLESGRYANLFAPTSYAVWVTNGVAAAKMKREEAEGAEISPLLAADAETVNANYYVIEINLESAFPDASIAYDVVGLRAIDAYLTLPDGMKVYPAQRIMGTSAAETQDGTLRHYGRTNILVFPKIDVLSGAPTLPGNITGVRLTLDGFNSLYTFEWAAAPSISAAPVPPQESGGMSWSALYSKLRELSRISQ